MGRGCRSGFLFFPLGSCARAEGLHPSDEGPPWEGLLLLWELCLNHNGILRDLFLVNKSPIISKSGTNQNMIRILSQFQRGLFLLHLAVCPMGEKKPQPELAALKSAEFWMCSVFLARLIPVHEK